MTIEGYLAHGEIGALKYVSSNYGGCNGWWVVIMEAVMEEYMDYAQNSFQIDLHPISKGMKKKKLTPLEFSIFIIWFLT